MRPTRRAASLLVAISLLLSVMAVPASAAAFASTTLTSGDLLSGQGGQVSLLISNTGSTGGLFGLGEADGSIDALQIEAPNRVFDTQSLVLPEGWDGEFDDEIGFVYAWAMTEDAELDPGSNMTVTLQGAARRIADDRTEPVRVFVSDDGGSTLSSAGSPNVTSRILQVVSSTVVKPASATNTNATQVTERQKNVEFRVTAVNHGSAARDVTFDIQQAAGGSSVDVTPVTASIAANDGSVTVDIPATFGDAGSLTLDATAASANSTANALRMAALSVQARFQGTYVPDSLSPRVVVPGDTPSFSLNVNKVGAQPVALDATFSFTGFTASTDLDIAAGGVNGVAVTFPPTLVEDTLDDGTFATSLDVTGVDGNGAVIDTTLVPDSVTLDSLAPVVDLLADVGDSEVTGATPAAGDGRDITFTGTVKLGPADDAALCTGCTIQDAAVVTNTGDRLPLQLIIEDGEISGVDSFTFPEGTTSARAEVTVSKLNGLIGTGNSDTFEVDILVPVVADAVTQRDPNGGGDSILVTMSELVNGEGTTATDWSVDNNLVTAVTPVGDAASTDQFVLEVSQAFDRNATPAVTYTRRPINDTVFDRVALDLVDQVIEARDGIAPSLPVIETVGGLGLQDGEFWINDPLTTVGLSGLDAGVGDVLILYWDRDDDGTYTEDEEVFRGDASSSSMEVELQQTLGDIEETHDLVATVLDGGGNFSPLAVEVLNLDYTLAELVDFVADGNEVTAIFSEPVPRGREAAFDWTVKADQGGQSAYRTVTQVTFVSPTERKLTVSTASYDPAAGDVTAIRYKFRGQPDDRYEDRATNEVANQEYPGATTTP